MLNDSSAAAPLYPTFSALPSGSARSQESEATVHGFSSGQNLKDTDYLNRGAVLDSLDNFDFNVNGYSPDVSSMQLPDGGVPDQNSTDRYVPNCSKYQSRWTTSTLTVFRGYVWRYGLLSP